MIIKNNIIKYLIMEISKAKDLKYFLAKNILIQLREYEKKTGAKVQSIDFDREESKTDQNDIISVELDVKI